MKKPKSIRLRERNENIYNSLKDIPVGSDRAIAVHDLTVKYDLTIAMVYRIFNNYKTNEK